ncbi:hypothetical protein BC360_00855 [Ensifer sp. LC163]|nr:hypothetical protein BC360_00855 [Ensifer sp. LC163]
MRADPARGRSRGGDHSEGLLPTSSPVAPRFHFGAGKPFLTHAPDDRTRSRCVIMRGFERTRLGEV